MRSHSLKYFSGKYSSGKYSRRFAFLFMWLGLLLAPDALAQDIPLPSNPLTFDLVQVDNTSGGAALDGFITNDLLVNTEGRLLGFQMMLFLDEGSIYQDPLGTNLPPTKLAVEAVAPSLAYDTFIAVGSPYANGAYGISGPYGRAVDITPHPKNQTARLPIMSEKEIDIAWSVIPGAKVIDVEDFLLSRVTLSDDARGYWAFFNSGVSTSDGYNYHYQARVGLSDQFGFSGGLGKVADGAIEFPPDIHYTNIHSSKNRVRKVIKVTPEPGEPLGKILGVVQRDNSSGGSSLEGFVTNDLLLDTEAQLSTFQLRLVLEQGEIFQDPLGANVAPAEGLADMGFPSLEFDTFVTLGRDTAGGPYGSPGTVGGAVDFGQPPQVEFDNDVLSITWYGPLGVPMYGSEDFLLSRISLSDDAIGSWDLMVSLSGRLDQVSGTIENGFLVDSWRNPDSPGDGGKSVSNAGDQQSQQDRFGQSNSEVPEPGTCALAILTLGLFFFRSSSRVVAFGG